MRKLLVFLLISLVFCRYDYELLKNAFNCLKQKGYLDKIKTAMFMSGEIVAMEKCALYLQYCPELKPTGEPSEEPSEETSEKPSDEPTSAPKEDPKEVPTDSDMTDTDQKTDEPEPKELDEEQMAINRAICYRIFGYF